MKFKRSEWIDVNVPPFHEGEYEVRLETGEVGMAAYRSRKWDSHAGSFSDWRGLKLKGTKRPKPYRQTLDDYRAEAPGTHAHACKAAHFLARRAVSMSAGAPAYRYYLIANAIDPQRLLAVDREWISFFAGRRSGTPGRADAERKVDRFFEKRGGRPSFPA